MKSNQKQSFLNLALARQIYMLCRIFHLYLPVFKCLTFSDICILHPFILHQHDYVRLPHGYRQRNGITRVSRKIESVENCIHEGLSCFSILDAIEGNICSCNSLKYFLSNKIFFILRQIKNNIMDLWTY